MKVYVFSYCGVWLGGTVIVVAPSLREARKLALRESLPVRRHHTIKKIKLEGEFPITADGAVVVQSVTSVGTQAGTYSRTRGSKST